MKAIPRAFWGIVLPLMILFVSTSAPVQAQGYYNAQVQLNAGQSVQFTAHGDNPKSGLRVSLTNSGVRPGVLLVSFNDGPTSERTLPWIPNDLEDIKARRVGQSIMVDYADDRWTTLSNAPLQPPPPPPTPTPTIAVPSSTACSSHAGWTQHDNRGPGPRKFSHPDYGVLEVNPYGEWRWVAPNIYGTPSWGRTPQGCKQSGVTHPDFGTVPGIVIQDNGTQKVLFVRDGSAWTVLE